MIQFYAPDIISTGALPESESAHCCRVLRMREGEEVQVVDGKGYLHRCIITSAHQKHTMVEIVNSEYIPSHWKGRITLAVAPTKNADRMEWMVEKVVEIGIDRIVLLQCDRSERKIMKTERLERVVVAAMKQSLKTVKPEVVDMIRPDEFFRSACKGQCQRFFGYCSPEVARHEFAREYQKEKDVVIMIGPEGDFSPREVELAMEHGFIPVTFGESRLRTETAALYGVTAVHVLNQL